MHVEQLRYAPVFQDPLSSNPLRWSLVKAIRRADVVHCHQVNTFVSSAAVILGRAMGRPVFVSDHGGGHVRSPSSYLPLMTLATAFLCDSEYSRQLWLSAKAPAHPRRVEVIHGGGDTRRFVPGGRPDPNRVVFVGRILPHKGIEYLIDAIAPPMTLSVVGQPYDQDYLAMLRDRARGKAVFFEHDVDDANLAKRYQSAFVVVQPSVSIDWRGGTTLVSELFGIAVVEAMLCARPVIVARTGALPERVDDGVTGFVVPPGDALAIRDRLMQLHAAPELAAEMGRRARQTALARFTWDATAERCMAAYRSFAMDRQPA